MHCFYIEAIAPDGRAVMPRDEARHAEKVLRLRPGDEVCAMDGAGRRWLARVARMDDGLCLELSQPLAPNEPPVQLSVYQGVPKAEKLEFLSQKLTELGAATLIPVKMERCVVKLDDKDGARRAERLARIAREAAKQCNRALPLTIAPPMGFKAALAAMADHDLLLVPWEDADAVRIRDVYKAHPTARSIGVVIGPEGGMSADEVRAMADAGARVVTLGPRILRTETAAVTAAALVMQLWGDI